MSTTSKKNSKRSPASTTVVHAPATPARKPNKDKKLTAWLNVQAKKLKVHGRQQATLKLDFVANVMKQGKILAGVKRRLGDLGRFKAWVEEKTDIGYSTALLWIDVASNPKIVKTLVANSNGLELTVRKVRDAVRDDRQAQDKGKPGSGKRKESQPDSTHPANTKERSNGKPALMPVDAPVTPRSNDNGRHCTTGAPLAHPQQTAPKHGKPQSKPVSFPDRSIILADVVEVSFDTDSQLIIADDTGYVVKIRGDNLTNLIEAALKDYRSAK